MGASDLVVISILAMLSTQFSKGQNLPKPNIVFILADDAGWNDFSFHGSAQIPTPNIDALAFGGTILNSHYASPLCTPTRGAIYSGKHPIHIGLQHYVIRGDTADGLPLSEKLLPEYLKELGYNTHLVGKWHLGHSTKLYSPTFRGFDSHFGSWLGYQDYYDHTAIDSGLWGYDFRNGLDVHHQAFGIYNTDLITQETKRIIREHDIEKPIFLMVCQTAPHAGSDYDPLQAPKENVAKFRDTIDDVNRRTYAGMVDKLDESIGEIVSTLTEKGILNNTIIVFASDNGGAPEGFALNYASNWPLRGVKNTLWEGGTRVAACVWSSLIKNRVSNNIVHVTDWLPTLYEAAGGNVNDLGEIDGTSFWTSLTEGGSSPRTGFLYNIDDIYNNSAIRVASWKLIQGNISTNDLGGGNWDGWYGFYNETSPVIDLIPKILQSSVAKSFESIGLNLDTEAISRFQEQAHVECSLQEPTPCDPYNTPCLFNIINDPCEQYNLADYYPEVVQTLQGLLQSYNATAREPIDLSHHPEAAPSNWGYVWTNWKDFE